MDPLSLVLNEFLSALMVAATPPPEMQQALHATVTGTATTEQTKYLTDIVHDRFDKMNGCMVVTVVELAEDGFPHEFIMHTIREYVRLCDRREAKEAQLAALRDKLHGDA